MCWWYIEKYTAISAQQTCKQYSRGKKIVNIVNDNATHYIVRAQNDDDGVGWAIHLRLSTQILFKIIDLVFISSITFIAFSNKAMH